MSDSMESGGDAASSLPPGWASAGRIDGWREFKERVTAALSWVADKPMNLVLSDRDFQGWPLGERAAVSACEAWSTLHTGTTMHLLLASGEALGRVHPRWVSWRQTHAHRVHAALAPDDAQDHVPTLFLLGHALGLRVLDARLGVGSWTTDRSTLQSWHEEVDAILQRSSCSLPVTTLGL